MRNSNFKGGRYRKPPSFKSQSHSEKLKNIRKARRENPLDSIVIRTIICIVAINLSIWGYFGFRGLDYMEGISGWQKSFRKSLGIGNDRAESQYSNKVEVRYIAKERGDVVKYQAPINLPSKKHIVNEKPQTNRSNLYKWKDKDGNIKYSNTTYPVNNPTLEVIEEKNSYNPETKFYYKNGTIIVPVIVQNNGRRERIRLMLDTGSSITQLHPDVIRRLKARKIRSGSATISNGSKIKTTISEIDLFQVGPHKKTNFTVSSNYIKSKNGIDGLLGMNFLDDHQFVIDRKRRVIKWK